MYISENVLCRNEGDKSLSRSITWGTGDDRDVYLIYVLTYIVTIVVYTCIYYIHGMYIQHVHVVTCMTFRLLSCSYTCTCMCTDMCTYVGLQSTASALAYQWSVQGSRGQGIELSKDTLSSTYVTTITQHLLEVVNATAHLLPDCAWISRWQKLSRRYAHNGCA